MDFLADSYIDLMDHSIGDAKEGMAGELYASLLEGAEVLAVESWAERLFRHPFSQAEMDFVSWSPPWLFERWDLSGGALPEGLPQQGVDTVEGGIRTTAVDAIAS